MVKALHVGAAAAAGQPFSGFFRDKGIDLLNIANPQTDIDRQSLHLTAAYAVL